MKFKYVFLCVLGLTFLLLNGCDGQRSRMEYIGADTAKQLALKASGLSETEVDTITTDLVTQDGQDCYQVDLTVEGQSYQYNINARTGVVMDAPPASTPGNSMDTSAEPAAPSPEETAEPDIQTGSAASTDATSQSAPPAETSQTPSTQPPRTTPAQSTQSPRTTPAPQTSSAGTPVMLTAEEAKQKALDHANLTSSQVTFVKCKLDYENGRQVYEIEFYTSGHAEYDYDIDAYTGAVVKFDYDAEDYAPPRTSTSPTKPTNSSGTNGTMLTADEAKAIALARVPGASASDIRSFEMDRDDGRVEYEGEIVYNGMEYEFEIDASSGAVRSWEVEPARH